jgi:hypothetical protein
MQLSPSNVSAAPDRERGNRAKPMRSRGWRAFLSFAAAIAAVVVVDVGLLGARGPWEAIDIAVSECGAPCRIVRNKTFAERELADLRRVSPHLWKVVIVGSSRAGAGFVPQAVPRSHPARRVLHLAKAAIPSAEPYAMFSLATRLGRDDIDEVVLYLSEFDTHRPPYLVPGLGYGGLEAFFELARLGGMRLSYEHHDDLMRLAAAAISNIYRHRDVIQALISTTSLSPGFTVIDDESIVGGGFRNALAMRVPDEDILPWDEFETIRAEIRETFPGPVPPGPFNQIRAIVPGEHVELQKNLVRSAVETLVARKIRVLIVESPIHPAGDRLFDVALREDFRAFAVELTRQEGVEFFSLDRLPAFTEEEFGDLTHLTREGGTRHTRAIVDHLATRVRATHESGPSPANRGS